MQIARACGVSQSVVSRICRKNNLSPNRYKAPTGDKSPGWKGGKTITDQGYVLVNSGERFPTMQNRLGYILEHRFVMAQYMERPLYNWETVHHIDGNRQNNALENLQLRIGKHGKHEAYICMDCGSSRVEPTKLSEIMEEPMSDKKKKKPIIADMSAGLSGKGGLK
jgi:hypothetical protein